MRTPDGDRRTRLERPDGEPTRQEAERDNVATRTPAADEWLKRYYDQSRRSDPFNPENQRKA